MFGKLFSSMYDGSLATRGPWQALVTFQQFIILADRTGIVDMTAEAIARRTTVPLEILKLGITALEQPDSDSRSPELDGRRIVRLSDTREWGWQIVNHAKYRRIRSEDERREYMANLMRERRAAAKSTDTDSKHALAKLAHADADADADAGRSNTLAPSATRSTPKMDGRRIEFDLQAGSFKGISEQDELRWQEAYPAVIVPQEIKAAAAWLTANPANRKSNNERFLVNWFKRTQDRAPRAKR